jgi:hypothetical protein
MWTRRCNTRFEAGDRRWVWVALVAAGAALAGLGCLFTPRDAPPPCTPGVDAGCKTPVPFKDPLTPEIVRDNIQGAIRKRGFDGPNLDNYDRSLNDLFAYVPDANTALTAPPCGADPFFFNWGKLREAQFMRKVLEVVGSNAVPDSAAIVFTVYSEDPTYNNTTDLKRYNVQYTLTLVYPESSGRGIECYGANAKWDLIGGDRNNWTLLRWEDLEPVPTPSCRGTYGGTMGVLRVREGECP